MKKTYNPHNIERKIYEDWKKRGYFKPKKRDLKESFCTMMPPPNITGNLHMGHAFQQTIMDVMVRYHRMLGKKTFYQVGIDHAGIATQIIVEQKIASKEGKTRYDYGYDAFIKEIWKWKKKSTKTIFNQICRLGNSVDWEKKRFTMDKNISNSVREVFIRLYEEGLIYRGKRLVNWDGNLNTSISDLEVENKESKGSIWYIRYPLADNIKTQNGKNYLVIATTRPETILGDSGVAVNPKDSRYNSLIGKFVISPLTNRRIVIIGDEYVDMKKGTGCMKITPAHDFNDYKIGCRHFLPIINILTFDGKICKKANIFDNEGNRSNIYSSEIPIKFQDLERFDARKSVINSIRELGLLEKIKPHKLTIPYSNRSGAIIEPMLTDQWFVRANVLSKSAIKAVKDGDIQFIPKQYENMYFSWMKNIQDWCISRQLWWGHRIPAWYDNQGKVYVGRNKKEIYKKNKLSSKVILYQEKDVLDTWFSSSLWTFSTLGWPKKTKFFRCFHPINVMVSGFDIIFFWIARMIMMTMHFVKDKKGNPQVPFKIVYITGLIRDNEGKKMSKSIGNVLDPLDMIDGISLEDLLVKRSKNLIKPKLADRICEKTKKQFPNGIKPHGTDALRFTLLSLASSGHDINWDMKRLKGYRNFCNKLWNASRFILMNTEKKDCGFNNKKKIFSLVDYWILIALNQTISSYRKALDSFRFDIAANIIYEFIWNQFCDWYLEFSKSEIICKNEEKIRGTRNTLVTVLEILLRLAHPIIPFITEIIWKRIKKLITKTNNKKDTIMLQPFPKCRTIKIDEKKVCSEVEKIKKIIVTVRNIRSEMGIPFNKSLDLFFYSKNDTFINCVKQNYYILKNMLRLENIDFISKKDKNPIFISRIIEEAEIFVPIENLINKNEELNRLEKEIKKIEKEIEHIRNKLSKELFLTRAPESLVLKEKNKLSLFLEKKEKFIKRKNVIEML